MYVSITLVAVGVFLKSQSLLEGKSERKMDREFIMWSCDLIMYVIVTSDADINEERVRPQKLNGFELCICLKLNRFLSCLLM